jgi:ubiquinone/menaquinone biosynthesis C-methylase UbiE
LGKLATIATQTIPYNCTAPGLFAEQYYLLRKKENRIYTDEELLQLPQVPPSHQYFNEWAIRKNSCNRLIKYLQQKGTSLQILEIGCGNGWLSAQLALMENALVTGIDINTTELKQAQRVFEKKENLDFINGDLRDGIVDDKIFDVVVFAASLQYFNSLKEIITLALQHLSLQGEIHIIDTNFYPQYKTAEAKQRTDNYFKKMGFENMEQFYFHHSINDLKKFNHSFLYDPFALRNRFNKGKNPFYHVVIKNRYQ